MSLIAHAIALFLVAVTIAVLLLIGFALGCALTDDGLHLKVLVRRVRRWLKL